MPEQPPFDFSATPGFAWNGVGALRVAVLTDLHVAEKMTEGGRDYFRSLFKLREAAAELAPSAPHFTVVLGDWVDGNEESPETAYPERLALTHLGSIPGPRYGVIGNHDCYIPDGRKSSLIATYGLPNSYYTFVTNGLRFIFLDAMVGLPQRYASDTEEREAAQTAKDAYFSERGENPSFPYFGDGPANGAFGTEQRAWLQSWLAYAYSVGEKVVIFSHTPCWPDRSPKNAWDADDVLPLLWNYSSLVVAWISGHRHADDYYFDGDGNTHHISLPALVEGPARNFSSISFTTSGLIVIEGYGDTSSRTLTPFTSP